MDLSEQVTPGQFQHSLNLVERYAGKVIEKGFQRIPCPQMVEQTLDRDARAAKDRFAAQAFRVLFDALSQTARFGLRIRCQTRCHGDIVIDDPAQSNRSI